MKNILEIKNLTVQFNSKSGVITALDNINCNISSEKVSAIIGESGSGKSVLANAIIGLLPKNAKARGEIYFEENDLMKISEADYQKIRGKKIAWIAQNPLSSLNPAWNINELISEAAIYHRQLKRRDKNTFSQKLLAKLNLESDLISKYSFELSGGMAQRVLIASGIGLAPKLLILDEPTKGLDSRSIEAVVEIIKALKNEKVTILLITHDLDFAESVAEEIMVVYQAKIVEHAPAPQFFKQPSADYCQKLLAARPKNGLNAINQAEIETEFAKVFQ